MLIAEASSGALKAINSTVATKSPDEESSVLLNGTILVIVFITTYDIKTPFQCEVSMIKPTKPLLDVHGAVSTLMNSQHLIEINVKFFIYRTGKW